MLCHGVSVPQLVLSCETIIARQQQDKDGYDIQPQIFPREPYEQKHRRISPGHGEENDVDPRVLSNHPENNHHRGILQVGVRAG